jgi:hypothetical protein
VTAITTTDKLEALRKVRDLLAVPERWTKEADARDAEGRESDENLFIYEGVSFVATCWCLSGAVHLVAPGAHLMAEFSRTLGVPPDGGSLGRCSVVDWNDAPERTHADVLKLIDDTIVRLETT